MIGCMKRKYSQFRWEHAHAYLGNVIWCQLNFDGHHKQLVNTLQPFLFEVLTTSGIQVEEMGQETFGYA